MKIGSLAAVVLGAAALSGCITPPGGGGGGPDGVAQSDLLAGLTAENGVYGARGIYDANTADMHALDGTVDWGGKLTVVVGDAVNPGDGAVVCLHEASTSGKAFNIAEVAIGSHAGEYRNAGGDCSSLSPLTLSGAWNTGW